MLYSGFVGGDSDAVPERDIAREIFAYSFDRAFHWLWIVPGTEFVGLSVNDDVVITRLSLPKTGRVVVAIFEVFALDGAWWKIPVAFYAYQIFLCRFGNDCVVPNSFHIQSIARMLIKLEGAFGVRR